MKISVDTNVLTRAVLQDDAKQADILPMVLLRMKATGLAVKFLFPSIKKRLHCSQSKDNRRGFCELETKWLWAAL